jgi:hypothetical protein
MEDSRFEQYLEKAKKFAKQYNVEDDHIINVIQSVMMTRDGFMIGGSFARAVVENQLFETINRADPRCLSNLKVIVASNHYCFL